MRQIVQTHKDPATVLLPSKPGKDARYRLMKFASWLQQRGRSWHTPDLQSYRDALLSQDYAPSTVSAHLSTIRARYRRLLSDNDTRTAFYRHVTTYLERTGQESTPANRKSLVDELTTRLENAIEPDNSKVTVKTRQDRPDSDHLRLNPAQATQLLTQPGLDTLQALRDTAIIALMLCTGIREAELVALDVKDLRQTMGSELALHVREGKGCKERLVPYGDLDWALVLVDAWLHKAVIESGPVFRGFYRGGSTVRPSWISKRAIGFILDRYPIAVNGHIRTVTPHDLRRTYARLQYEGGMDLLAIKDNLGHAAVDTTLGYIGELDADARRARAVVIFDLSTLEELVRKGEDSRLAKRLA
jgi:site-specific recombinase XerD